MAQCYNAVLATARTWVLMPVMVDICYELLAIILIQNKNNPHYEVER